MQGEQSSSDLRGLLDALTTRKGGILRERERASTEALYNDWTSRLDQVEQQVVAIKQELAISSFVEASVRVSASRPRLTDEERAELEDLLDG